MSNLIETKEHIIDMLKLNFKSFDINLEELFDNILYSDNEIDDNLINTMLEEIYKLKSYLEKLRDGMYE